MIDLFYKSIPMSVGRIILAVFIVGVFLFAVAMYLALTPSIKDVSDNVALKKYLNKTLTIKRNALVTICEEADYNFIPNVLTEEAQGACQEKYDLSIPVYFDSTIAAGCGVYSTPQAVIINTDQRLHYRGNYNKSHYCTDKKTNNARPAVTDKLPVGEWSSGTMPTRLAMTI